MTQKAGIVLCRLFALQRTNTTRILLAPCNSTYEAAESVKEYGLCAVLGDQLQRFKKYEYLLVSASKP